MNIIEKAKKFAEKKHYGQFRMDKSPYINHPLRVGEIIRKYSKENNLIVAGILHDTIEGTDTTSQELKENFGDIIASLVTELTSDKTKYKKIDKAKYLSEKLIKMSDEALIIKLADRLDNVFDLNERDKKFAVRYKKETEDILKNLEEKRKLLEIHKKLIEEIRGKMKNYYKKKKQVDELSKKYNLEVKELVRH